LITIGLTGNVASGKTTVAERWREAGVHVIDADRLGHRVLEEDMDARGALVEAFDREILAPDGSVDRDVLGARAFDSSDGVRTLNEIVHPPLVERLDAELARARERGEEIVAIDAALLLEFGIEVALDVLVVVTAPRDVRADRLVRERGLARQRIAKIMAAQMPDAEKAAAGDYVIANDGSIEDLHARADAVLGTIREEFHENGAENEDG